MDLDEKLTLLARDPAAPVDLAELALSLAREEYPSLDVEAYLGMLDGMAHEAGRLLRGPLDRRVQGLCRYLFHDLGFRGNQADYYDARNSYLNDVLDRRLGIPISLSAVAMVVGSRAGLEVVGVGLPGHFVCKAVDADGEVIFDPFHGGRVLHPEQCGALVEQVTGLPFEATAENLGSVPVGLIAQRMLTNLKGVYLGGGDFPRAARVTRRLAQLRPEDVMQRRDLGVTLLRAARPGEAINHLEAYLAGMPEAEDAEVVRKLLGQARGLVAKWN
jgi:regulator of sirC expression with transglutaminase-like and TPR domain